MGKAEAALAQVVHHVHRVVNYFKETFRSLLKIYQTLVGGDYVRRYPNDASV